MGAQETQAFDTLLGRDPVQAKAEVLKHPDWAEHHAAATLSKRAMARRDPRPRNKQTASWRHMRPSSMRRLQRPATTDIKDAQVRNRFDLEVLRGPAITEIERHDLSKLTPSDR